MPISKQHITIAGARESGLCKRTPHRLSSAAGVTATNRPCLNLSTLSTRRPGIQRGFCSRRTCPSYNKSSRLSSYWELQSCSKQELSPPLCSSRLETRGKYQLSQIIYSYRNPTSIGRIRSGKLKRSMVRVSHHEQPKAVIRDSSFSEAHASHKAALHSFFITKKYLSPLQQGPYLACLSSSKLRASLNPW